MIISHVELKNIHDTIFGESLKEAIDEFMAQDLDNSQVEYRTDCLWKADVQIGGIGGYCMPANPVKNPFPAGKERALYRPLQYARSNIDICDVRMQARWIIESVGMHLEEACRLYLKDRLFLGALQYRRMTLGKAVQKIKAIGNFDDSIMEALWGFVTIYNRSKHEINQDLNRDRMFNAYDAIVAYFAARVLGVFILRELDVRESFIRYPICNETEL